MLLFHIPISLVRLPCGRQSSPLFCFFLFFAFTFWTDGTMLQACWVYIQWVTMPLFHSPPTKPYNHILSHIIIATGSVFITHLLRPGDFSLNKTPILLSTAAGFPPFNALEEAEIKSSQRNMCFRLFHLFFFFFNLFSLTVCSTVREG